MADNGPTQRWEDVLTGDVLELCLYFAGSLSTYRAMRVCVLWANVASRPSLHRTLSLHAAREGQVGCDLQSDCFTNVALRRCLAMGRVQEISLSGFQGLSAECFGDLRKQAPDLLALSLFNCPQIDDQSLLPILPSKLAYLQMHQCCRRIPGSLLWLTSNLQGWGENRHFAPSTFERILQNARGADGAHRGAERAGHRAQARPSVVRGA